jgi:hypothetical protein
MKYVSDREQFLKKYKSINEETQAGSGVLGNEIKWGDSLLGRLINHFIRKAGVGVNMGRIKLVASQLESEFDSILASSAIEDISEEDKIKVFKTQISALLGALKDAVYNKEKVGKIKQICDVTISDIEKIKVDEDSEKTKSEILEKLKEFREWLNQFDDEDGVGTEDSDDSEENEKSDKDESVSDSQSFNSPEIYMNIVNNLKSISLMIKYYKNVKLSGAESTPKYQSGENFFTTKGGETIKSIYGDKSINKFNLELEQIWKNNSKILQPYLDLATQKKTDKNTLQLKAGLKINLAKINESMIFEDTFGTGGAKDRANVKSGEDHLTQAFSKIKRDLEILISEKEKGVGVTAELIDQIVSNSKDKENRDIIRELYSEVRRYLVGDKKDTIQDKDALYKESIELLKDKNKKVIVAEKIARFSKRAMQFDNQNLYGGLGDFGKALKQFVDTLKPILKSKEEKAEVKESILRNYSSFIKLIREAEENEPQAQSKSDDSNPKDIKTPNVSDKIIDYFEKKFNFDAWVVDKTEIDKLEKNIDKVGKEQKDLVINGIDPILNIVKLFNRAYKLHTVPVIPGGRSGGAVNRSTFSEYDAFGYSSGEPNATSQGPYRNKKIFNIWENAVLDIMKERKYQPIFNVNTKIRIGDELKPKAGVALRQFMTDMLDGEKLYKGDRGEGGSTQKKFLAKYFGDIKEFQDVKDDQISYSDPKTQKLDVEENSELANEIPTPNYSFVGLKKVESSEEFVDAKFKGMIFQFRGIKDNGKESTLYLFVQSVSGGMVNLSFATTFYYFLNYCKEQIQGSPDFEAGKDGATMNKEKGDKKLFATKISLKDFENLFDGGKLELKAISSDDEKSDFTIDVKSAFVLGKKGKEENIEIYKSKDDAKTRLSVDKVGGFKEIENTVNKTYKDDFKPISRKL